MASEYRWLFSPSYVYIFVVIILGLYSVTAEKQGDSYYRYDSSLLASRHSDGIEWMQFHPSDELLIRNPRSPLEPTKSDNNTTATETVRLSSAPKSNSTSDNVAYSTVNSTKNNSTPQQSQMTNTTSKAEVIVSQPLNPITGKVDNDQVKVWANRTRQLPGAITPVRNDTKDNIKPAIGDDPVSDDISINKFNDLSNATFSENNVTRTVNDTHQYYYSTFSVIESEGKKFWVDMVNHPNVSVNEVLSDSHRRAATVRISFDFPFYGHLVRNVTIATGGFLYTGEHVHNWLAATQYIAPLMANFDTRLSNKSNVKYADNGTAFTVEWERVVLQEKPDVGEFTFQVTLHKNGDIVFVYAAIPLVVEKIQDNLHPVKVGLSDAYIIDRTVFFVRRKTIYEYHRVNFMSQDIKNWTTIYLRALPTCLGMDNCGDCLNKTTGFECKWCPRVNRCSTGTDRHRHDWLVNGCESKSIKQGDSCPATILNPAKSRTYDKRGHDNQSVHEHEATVHSDDVFSSNILTHQQEAKALGPMNNKMSMGVSGIIGILAVISLVAAFVGWAVYAYRNPHSASGQVLIRYRPSQWSWRRGEARYTAATIHM